ncbi:BamA/TamA family outer membrane protein [Algoriphagus sp.]|uniref:translocation and assembly module lipoprotein TamL n=1 Tax=Algoriphagus sp. TaxID=1872435 RepID=UPI00391B278B
MKIKSTYLALLVLITSFVIGCSVKKYIPEGEKLYTGASLSLEFSPKVKERKDIEAELENLFRPRSNKKILGGYPGVWAHYKSQEKKPGFILRFINKKIGEKPVYLSMVNPELTEDLILNRLDNKGFFFSESSSQIKEKKYFASVEYEAIVSAPYQMTSLTYERDSFPIDREIIQSLDKSVLKKGDRFELERFKKERERIDSLLKANGYYNFNKDYLIFEADTNTTDSLRSFDLYLSLKPNIPKSGLIPYVVDSILVFPNYSVKEEALAGDTVVVNGKSFIQDVLVFKPKLLDEYILIQSGELYNPTRSRLSSNRLSSIGNYKFVNLRYNELPMEDSLGHLTAIFQLSPLTKRSLRAELLGVSKSNSFAGPALNLIYRNRNLFRGGETFSITSKVGYEVQLASGERQRLESLELGLQGDLIIPRIMFFFPINEKFSYSVPKTKINLGTEYLSRGGLYRLNSFFVNFGYFWNASRFAYHEFNPISINLVNLTRASPEFETILDSNPFLRRSFDQNFIVGLNYLFNYNKLNDKFRTHAYFLGFGLDFAGNAISLIDRATGGANGKIFGLEYAQYSKFDVDLRYHLNMDKNQTIATRLFVGAGFPYGNSSSLPFSKQFFSGGPHSLRAFRIRSIGPGSYRPETLTLNSFFDQAGDIRLEGNIEYRFPIFSILKGAVFMDGGNVWLQNENEALPGGKFSSRWWKEIAVGTGVGVRVDIQFFVLRFDLGVPVRLPYLPDGEQWGNSFNIGSRSWRQENLIFNFAIGYPF